MDTETVDRQFTALQRQAQQTATLIQTLADKLSTAATTGDPNAREWALDLKEIALAIRDEQGTTTDLLQAIHALVDNHVTATEPPRRRTTHRPPSTRNRRNTRARTNRSTSGPRRPALGRCSGSLAGGSAKRSSRERASASATTSSTASSTDSEPLALLRRGHRQ